MTCTFEEFCHRFHALLDQRLALPRFIEQGGILLGQLLTGHDWLQEFLAKMLLDKQFLNQQEQSVWSNEMLLYRGPDRSLAVMAYVWEPDGPGPVHDHGSWGLVGSLIGEIRETKYRRLDDGRTDGFARLEQTEVRRMRPGETTSVLPLDAGIHRMEAINGTAVSISVYGKSLGRGYIQFFDPIQNTVRPAYPPKALKQLLAVRTLGAITEDWAKDLLTTMTSRPTADFMKRECQVALSKLEKTRPNVTGSSRS